MFDLPSDWSESELRNAAQKGALSFTDGDWIEAPYIASSGIRLLQTGNVGRGFVNDKPETRKYISLRTFGELGCKWVRYGDILICRLADPIGRACEVPEHLDKSITSVDVTIFKVDPSEYSARYVLHYLNSEINLKLAADSAGGSTRSRISRTNLGQLPLPKPPLAQQIKIAEVFDTLDTQIQKTEALIAKLKKVKEGLLHDLLTRGIDENGQLRPSPEQAPELYKESPLGLIPREWQFATADQFCTAVADGTHDSPKPAAEGYPLATSKNLKPYGLDLTDSYLISKTDYEQVIKRSWVEEGDILFGMIGTIGNPAALTHEQTLIAPKNVGIFRLSGDFIKSSFLLNYLASRHLANQIDKILLGSTQKFVGLGTLKSLIIPTPSRVEMGKISGAINSFNQKISLEKATLKKRTTQKSGLMDDLLTGRVRVTPLLDQAQATTPA